MNNVILVDYDTPKEWDFHQALENITNQKWKVIKAISNMNHGNNLQKLIRYWKYFAFPFRIFLERKQFASIVAWQQFYGLILAFYFRVFRVRNAPSITVMTFIYKPKTTFVGKLYAKFMKYVVQSGYIRHFVVFSKNEREHYAKIFGVAEELFWVEKLGITDEKQKYNSKHAAAKYYLSAGRSNRDYDFLLNAWGTRADKLKIICDACHFQHGENIECLTECYNEQYMEELSNCYAVILPLQDQNISSGQLVVLQAMMFGKPIIVTKSQSISDYIQNEKNGIIIEKDVTSFENAIKQLNKQEIYNKISTNARHKFEQEFSAYSMGIRLGMKLNMEMQQQKI